MTAFSTLVPFRPDGDYRERAWAWLEQRWRLTLPEAELVVSTPDDGKHPGEFNHPQAINRAARLATHDVLVVADADTAFHPDWVRQAVEHVAEGAPWVLATHYCKLDEQSSARVLEGDPGDPIEGYTTEWVGERINWSGLVVVPRVGFERVGGYDERISWWGSDDIAFGLTMDALWGRHYRHQGAALHLWHPTPSEHNYGHSRHAVQDALRKRYTDAAEDAEALREVRFG